MFRLSLSPHRYFSWALWLFSQRESLACSLNLDERHLFYDCARKESKPLFFLIKCVHLFAKYFQSWCDFAQREIMEFLKMINVIKARLPDIFSFEIKTSSWQYLTERSQKPSENCTRNQIILSPKIQYAYKEISMFLDWKHLWTALSHREKDQKIYNKTSILLQMKSIWFSVLRLCSYEWIEYCRVEYNLWES